ncbi:hypothetical protein IKT18_01130 [Candidatus Saccharibacteria bacterium]|nr:hypothetical protein [Candidatus Saccharibacteria bacterium]
MKKYLADILVGMRLIFAVVLFVMAFAGGEPGVGFLVFVLGELTDAFDGTCASRWPFPAGKEPKYRRYAAKYDMLADMLLGVGMALFFIFRVDFVAGWIICGGYSALALISDFFIYGKIFGHPDDFKKWSLAAHNFKLAKIIVLARRRLYVALIVLIAIWTLYASGWDLVVKVIFTIFSIIVAAWLWFFLAQRRNNISRDAVEIEKKLGKKRK